MRRGYLEKRARDLSSEHAHALFTPLAVILVAFSLSTYPYIPGTAVGFYTVFLLGAVAGDALLSRSGGERSSSPEWMVFSSFSLTVLLSRAFINTAGIATPKSSGALGPLNIEQLWFNGVHVHHYTLGFLLLLITAYGDKTARLSRAKTWALSGIGFALVADEFGILTLGHTYHSPVSYAAVIAVQAGLFALLLKHVRKT